MRLAARAPGKVNLGLLLGPPRSDGRHELASLLEPLSLADEVVLAPAGEGEERDVVSCEGVEGVNLATRALEAYRALTGWDGPPVRLAIDKRVPVAAGMGGGSSDAAAALRLAGHAAGRPLHMLVPTELAALAAAAFGLGADVPALLDPGPALVLGAGEDVRPLPALPAHGVLVLPSRERLSTAEVFARADRSGAAREPAAFAELATRLARACESGAMPPAELLRNDLQAPAIELCPAIGPALEEAREAGADHALLSGSGPTVFGLFLGADGERRARDAARVLAGREPAPIACAPVSPEWARPRTEGAEDR